MPGIWDEVNRYMEQRVERYLELANVQPRARKCEKGRRLPSWTGTAPIKT